MTCPFFQSIFLPTYKGLGSPIVVKTWCFFVFDIEGQWIEVYSSNKSLSLCLGESNGT